MHPDGVCSSGELIQNRGIWGLNYSWHPPGSDRQRMNSFSTTLTVRCRSSFLYQPPFSFRSRYQVNIRKRMTNSVRDEFTGMLKKSDCQSNNGIERSKYITFGIPAEGLRRHSPSGRVEADVMGTLSGWARSSEPMGGRARLALLHSQMHPGAARRSAFVERHPQTGSAQRLLPGQSRLPPGPHIPHRPVLGRGVLLTDYGIGAFG